MERRHWLPAIVVVGFMGSGVSCGFAASGLYVWSSEVATGLIASVDAMNPTDTLEGGRGARHPLLPEDAATDGTAIGSPRSRVLQFLPNRGDGAGRDRLRDDPLGPPPDPVEPGLGRVWTVGGDLRLSYNLTDVQDEAALRADRRGALRGLAEDEVNELRANATPIVLVHGINGQPADLQAIVQRFRRDERFQLYVYAYDDMGRRTSENGADLAGELERLLPSASGDVFVVAHSMGGLVTRVALNHLGPTIERLTPEQRLRVLAIDTPWHGFAGPSDHGVPGLLMVVVRPMLPDGLEDMRAESNMFTTMFDTPLPPRTELRIAAADAMDDGMLHWGEGKMVAVVDGLIKDGPAWEPSDPPIRNYWRALQSSTDAEAFRAALSASHDRGAVEAALGQYFPVFPGSHTGVLAEKRGGLPAAVRRWVLDGSWGQR